MKYIDEYHKKLVEKCEALGVEHDIGKRWEKGIPHHPKSVEYMGNLMDADWFFCGDYFCWKKGGDGDNGETLMYGLDVIFELEDKLKEDK